MTGASDGFRILRPGETIGDSAAPAAPATPTITRPDLSKGFRTLAPGELITRPNAEPAAPESPGFVSGLKRGFQRTLPETKELLGAAEIAGGQLIGSEGLTETGIEQYQSAKKEAEPYLTPSFADVREGKSGFGEFAGGVLGNFGGQALQSAAAVGVGALAGGGAGSVVPGAGTAAGGILGAAAGLIGRKAAMALARETAEKYIAEQIGKGVAKSAAEAGAASILKRAATGQAAKLGAVAAPFAINAGQEIGSAVSNRIQDATDAQGISAADAARQITPGQAAQAIGAGTIAGAVDTATEAFNIGKIVRPVLGEAGGVLSRVARQAVGGALREGGTEVAQSALERAGGGSSLTNDAAINDYIESGVAGAIGGAAIGAPAGIRRPRFEGAKPGSLSDAANAVEPNAAPTPEPAVTRPNAQPAAPVAAQDPANPDQELYAGTIPDRPPADPRTQAAQAEQAPEKQRGAAAILPAPWVNPDTGELGLPSNRDEVVTHLAAQIGSQIAAGRSPRIDANLLGEMWGINAKEIRNARVDALKLLNSQDKQVQKEARAAERDQQQADLEGIIRAPKPDDQASKNQAGATAAAPDDSQSIAEGSSAPSPAADQQGSPSTRRATGQQQQDTARASDTAELSTQAATPEAGRASDKTANQGASDLPSLQDTPAQTEINTQEASPSVETQTTGQATVPADQAPEPVRSGDGRVGPVSEGSEAPASEAGAAPVQEGGSPRAAEQVAQEATNAPTLTEPAARGEAQALPSDEKGQPAPGVSQEPAAVDQSAAVRGEQSGVAPPNEAVSGVREGTDQSNKESIRTAQLKRLEDREASGTLDKQGKKELAALREATAAPTAPVERTHAQILSDTQAVRKRKPRSLTQMFGKNPTPDQVAQHAELVRAYNRDLRAASKGQKEALARENAAFRASQAAPAVSTPASTPAPTIDTAAHEAATSPKNAPATVEAAAAESAASPANNLPEPTPAQHEANNYKQGHIKLHGLDVTIQVPKGAMRRGTDAKGKAWERAASDHYGHIRGTESADGEQVDVWLGPDAEKPDAKVFVIKQLKPGTQKYDENKAMIGFPNGRAARKSYDANFPKGLKTFGGITPMSIDQFKEWVKTPEAKKPAPAKPDTGIPASEQKASAAEAPAAIENFGEALPPARRNRGASLDAELTDAEITAQPLSKIWPAEEIDKIEDKTTAAIAFAARAEIPAKPRKGYKLRRWVEQVKIVRGLAQLVTGGTVTNEQMLQRMREDSRALEGFAAKVTVLDAIDREQWKRIGQVREYPNAYRYEGKGPDAKQVPSPFVQVEIDGRPERFDGATSVADVIEKVGEKLGTEAVGKRLQFEVRGAPGDYAIYKKGDKQYRPLKKFTDPKEALAYRKTGYDDLVAQWEKVKDRDNVTKSDMRNVENRPRTAADHRGGKDATTAMFEQAFGFRGVEFGKWVGQGKAAKERQGLLNEAYDALLDLAEIVGVPPRAISLNGTLGLGLGSRGHGWASAHFEPSNLVINLTKTRGAGAIAHEWFHALDNYFARQRGGEIPFTGNQADYRKNNYITYRPEPLLRSKMGFGEMTKAEVERRHKALPGVKAYLPENWETSPDHKEGVRPAVERAFADLVAALNDSPMTKRAAKIDGAKIRNGEGYWSQIIERGARSFENYVISKMAEKGYHNDFLANVKSIEDFPRDRSRYPYLLPEEVAPIAEAFDNLFATIQTKEDAAGNVILFDLLPAGQDKPAQANTSDKHTLTIAKAIRDVTSQWGPNQPSVRVLRSAEDLPATVKQDPRYVRARGVYLRDQGAVYLVAPNFKTTEDALSTLAHEVIGHHGIESILDQYVKGGWKKMAADFDRLFKNPQLASESIRSVIKSVNRRYAGADAETKAKEAIAIMAERGLRNGLIGRVIAAVRAFLRNLMPSLRWSDAEIRGLLQKSEDFIKAGPSLDKRRAMVAAMNFSQPSPQVASKMERWNAAVALLREEGVKDAELIATLAQNTAEAEKSHDEITVDPVTGKKFTAAQLMDQLRAEGKPDLGVIFSKRRGYTVPQIVEFQKWMRTVNKAIAEGANADHVAYATGVADGSLAIPDLSRIDESHPFSLPAPTDSAAFKRFFEGSKVVNKDGTPKPLYHGTAEGFTVFEDSHAGRSTGHMSAPLGHFFAEDRNKAEAYAAKAADGVPADERVIEVYAAIRNPKVMTVDQLLAIDSQDEARAMRADLVKQGYDGIHMPDVGQWVAFQSGQVKSVENRGTFDASNPDINFSLPEPDREQKPAFSQPAPSIDAMEAALSTAGDPAFARAKQWVRGKYEDLKPKLLGALQLSNILEIAEEHPALRGASQFAELAQAMDADRNALISGSPDFEDHPTDMLKKGAAVIAENWAKAERENGPKGWIGGKKPEAKALADVMHEATQQGLDPSAGYKRLTMRTSRDEQVPWTKEGIKERISAIRGQMRGRSGDDKTEMIAEIKYLRSLPKREKARERAWPALVAKYQALSPEAKTIYQEVRDWYRQQREATRDALIDRIDALDLPDQQKRHMVSALRLQFESSELEVFFPLDRNGEYWISVVDKDGNQGYKMFESAAEFADAEKKLRAAGFDIAASGRKDMDYKAKNAPSGTFIADIMQPLIKSGAPEKVMDEIYQIFLKSLPEMSMRKRFVHRKGIPGYSDDAQRAFSKNGFHGSHQLAKLRYSHKLQAVVDGMQKSMDNFRQTHDVGKADPKPFEVTGGDALLGELKKRLDWILSPTDSQVANVATSIGFMYYLGASPAAALVNLTQGAQVTLPVLGAKHGWARAMRALGKATIDSIRTGGNIYRTLTSDEERMAYKVLERRGDITRTQQHTLAGLAEGNQLRANPAWAKTMDIIGGMFHKAEIVNREAAGIAAFRLASADGLSFEEATKYASDIINGTHFNYSAANRSRVMQGNVLKVLFQFKNYVASMSWLLYRNLYQSIKGQDAETRHLARRTLTGVLGMTSLFAGVTGIPIINLAKLTANAAHAAFGDDDDLWDFDTEFRAWLSEHFGSEVASLIADGAVNQIGVDVAGRVGLADLWVRDGGRDLEGRDAYYQLLESIAGPIGGIGKNFFVGSQMVSEGKVWRGVETMLPKFTKDAMKAIRYESEGVNSLRGDPIIKDVGVGETLAQAIGFRPTRLADQQRVNNALKNYEQWIRDRKSSLTNAYVMAVQHSDSTARTSILSKIQAFNRKYPEIAITTSSLRQSMRKRAAYSEKAEGGILLNRKLASRLRDQVGVATP